MILDNIHGWTGLETATAQANNGARSIFSCFIMRILLHTTNKQNKSSLHCWATSLRTL